jgi:hypothetical protein
VFLAMLQLTRVSATLLLVVKTMDLDELLRLFDSSLLPSLGDQ